MFPVYSALPNIHKIAVLRANALGDFILSLPALQALRDTYPHAEIVLLARPWHQAFLQDRPNPCDRVIPIPNGGMGHESEPSQDPDELAAFFEAMHQENFDLAIQLHGGGRNSNPFTLNLGAKFTIGLRTPDAPELDRWVPYIYFQPEVLRYLEVVSLVGARTADLTPKVIVTERDRTEALSVLSQIPHFKAGKENSLIALHPSATDPRRRWPPEKFAALGDAIAQTLNVTILITGTPAEQDVVESVIQAMQTPAINLCGQLSLGGLAGLLAQCQVVISNDSGPMHLAHAVGTPTVGIYWCGNLFTAGTLTRTYHRPLISWRLNCPVCDVNCMEGACYHRDSFVVDISVESALSAALELYDRLNLN